MHVNTTIENIELKGSLRLVTKDLNGNVLSDNVVDNNILLAIRVPIVKLLGGFNTPTNQLPIITAINFGSDNTAPTIYQTDLIAPVDGATKALLSAPAFSQDNLRATFAVVFGPTEFNGITFKEAVLKTATGVAVARTVIGSYTKSAGTYFEFYWTIGYSA